MYIHYYKKYTVTFLWNYWAMCLIVCIFIIIKKYFTMHRLFFWQSEFSLVVSRNIFPSSVRQQSLKWGIVPCNNMHSMTSVAIWQYCNSIIIVAICQHWETFPHRSCVTYFKYCICTKHTRVHSSMCTWECWTCYVTGNLLCEMKLVMWNETCYVKWNLLCEMKLAMWNETCYVKWNLLCEMKLVMWNETCYVKWNLLCEKKLVIWNETSYVKWNLLCEMKLVMRNETCYVKWNLKLVIMLAIEFPGKKRIFMMNKTMSEIIRDIF